MANIDEIFDTMTAAEEAVIDFLEIDPDTRQIAVPESERVFGVVTDADAERKYFRCPRYVGDGLDLAGMYLTVHFRNANGEEDGWLVDDVQVSGDFVTFSWRLSEKVTAYKGAVQFGVCADLPSTTGRRAPEWNTTLATGEVLEGMDPDAGDVEAETSDVVTQLRAMTAAQTVAVEATGAEQVAAVKAAAAAATTAAQDQVAAKAAEVLAAIPADYSTMGAKVNEFANAIKGRLSGEIVRADDVSTVEHFPAVRVRSKNLFNADKIRPTGPFTNYAYITTAGDGAVTIYSNATDNGYCSTGLTLRDICPDIVAGKVYTLSGTTEAAERPWMYFLGANVTVVYGRSFTATEDMLASNVVLYGFNGKESGAGSCTISNIQIEEGETATNYAPYIAPETVKLTRCGKNMFDCLSAAKVLGNGTVTSRTASTMVVTGPTQTWQACCFALPDSLAGHAIAVSGSWGINGSSKGGLRVQWVNNMGTTLGNIIAITTTSGVPAYGVVPAKPEGAAYLCLFVYSNTDGIPAASDAITYSSIQVEAGDVATDFETYKTLQTFTPLEDGSVPGVTSLAPTMSLLTDTAGVTITAEYNRDTNQVVQKLIAAITAMGGTV